MTCLLVRIWLPLEVVQTLDCSNNLFHSHSRSLLLLSLQHLYLLSLLLGRLVLSKVSMQNTITMILLLLFCCLFVCFYASDLCSNFLMNFSWIGHFRVPPGLCFKTRVGAQPLIWKSFFILMQIKLIFTRKVVHLASFWKWGSLELGSGLLI